jgi:hypothetical protein
MRCWDRPEDLTAGCRFQPLRVARRARLSIYAMRLLEISDANSLASDRLMMGIFWPLPHFPSASAKVRTVLVGRCCDRKMSSVGIRPAPTTQYAAYFTRARAAKAVKNLACAEKKSLVSNTAAASIGAMPRASKTSPPALL